MSNNRFKILILEEESSGYGIAKIFGATNAYHMITADTLEQGMMLFSSYIPDLVLIALEESEKDTLEFIREVRKSYITPIIIISSRTQEGDVVTALDMGANDYLKKPFGQNELLARVRVALRERSFMAEAEQPTGGKYTLEDLVIDYDRRQVIVSGKTVRLTQTEYNIVTLLSRHTGKVMTYAEIIRSIWGSADVGSVKKLQVNMVNIRKKLGEKPSEAKYICNVQGVGYRMCEE